MRKNGKIKRAIIAIGLILLGTFGAYYVGGLLQSGDDDWFLNWLTGLGILLGSFGILIMLSAVYHWIQEG